MGKSSSLIWGDYQEDKKEIWEKDRHVLHGGGKWWFGERRVSSGQGALLSPRPEKGDEKKMHPSPEGSNLACSKWTSRH